MCNTSCENMTEGMTCWQSAPVQTLHEEEEPCSGEKNYYWTQLCNASGMWSNLTKHGCDQIAYITLNSSSRTLFEYLNLRAYIERKYISGTLTPTVIIATTNLLYEIVNEATPNQTLSSVILESISYILQSPEKILQESGSSNKLLKMITHIGENMELNASEIQIVHDNLAMVILQGSEGGDGVAFTTATTNQKLSSGHIEIMKNENKPSDKASIFVPLGVVVTTNGSIEQARLIFTIFRNSAVFDSMAKGSKVARGEVISASVENRTIKGLSGDRRIRIRFGDREITDGVGKNRSDGKKCVFWDVEKYEWSGKGCFRSDNSRDGNITNYVTCICDHLTNFAMLFDYGQMDASQENALSIISLIGCSFSILGLTLTLLSYLIFPQMREGRRYRPSWILINLCCSLLGVIIVFLVSFTQKPKSGPCVALACILHYLLLVSISWMSVEAISMYLAFVKVFDDGINYFLAKSSGAAWGVPFIVIVLTIAINLEHYTNAKTCWLRQDVIPFAFMLPSGILTVFNVVMFAMIARTLTSVSVKTKTKQKGMRRLRVIFSVMVVTGMSWAFGYLITEEFSLIFSYLFAIFNSLQGSLIFLLYCARNPDVQKCWLSLIQRSKKESNRHSTTGGMPTSSVKAIPERIETTQGDPKPITTKLHSPVIISKHTSEVYLSCEDSASSDSSFEDHSDRAKPPLVKQMSQVTILYDNVSEKSPSPSKTEFHELDVVQEVEGKNVNVEDSVPS